MAAKCPSRAGPACCPAQEADPNHAVVLLDSDIASVDVWQMVNWPSRWGRALHQMQQGRMLVLPAFQLLPRPGHAFGLPWQQPGTREFMNIMTAGEGGGAWR